MTSQNIIIKKGKEILQAITPTFEQQKRGKFVTIEIKSGKFFVGRSPIQEINKAKRQFPHKQFFIAQIGQATGFLK